MNGLRVKIDLPDIIVPCIKFVWILFTDYLKMESAFVPTGSDLIIGLQDDVDIQISDDFYRIIRHRKYHHGDIFQAEPLLRSKNGRPDYLGTAFYMLNYLQEYAPNEKDIDDLGRFQYKGSYQYKFDCVKKDLVTQYFDHLHQSIPILARWRKSDIPSKVFLSHDIDIINRSILQEGKFALKHGKFFLMLNVILKYILEGPPYLNMDKIMNIHDEHGLKSTFFWLVERGKVKSPFSQRVIPQADYNIKNKKIRNVLLEIEQRGFDNGLHKSSHPSDFESEIKKLPVQISSNRNHFLLLRLPQHFDNLQKSGLKLDCSMGFAGSYGHRNSYGRPILPFSLNDMKTYSFLEVPLNIMDTTLRLYLKKSPTEARNAIIDYLEIHKHNSIISILWHNDMFSPHKNAEWLSVYKQLLEYISENEFTSTNQGDLLKERERQLTLMKNEHL